MWRRLATAGAAVKATLARVAPVRATVDGGAALVGGSAVAGAALAGVAWWGRERASVPVPWEYLTPDDAGAVVAAYAWGEAARAAALVTLGMMFLVPLHPRHGFLKRVTGFVLLHYGWQAQCIAHGAFAVAREFPLLPPPPSPQLAARNGLDALWMAEHAATRAAHTDIDRFGVGFAVAQLQHNVRMH